MTPDAFWGGGVELVFTGTVVEWRGPAPFHFVPLPPDEAELGDAVEVRLGVGR